MRWSARREGALIDAVALGSAKAVLDDGKYAGSVTKSGHFTMCVCLALYAAMPDL
jgi:hypothetical protein